MVTTRVNIANDHFIEWTRAHPTLVEVMRDVLRLWPRNELYVTSFNRLVAEDRALGATGIHSDGPPWRAIDIRVISLGPDYVRMVDELAVQINRDWSYDSDRANLNVAVSQRHGTGPHLHIQICQRTRRRRDAQYKGSGGS